MSYIWPRQFNIYEKKKEYKGKIMVIRGHMVKNRKESCHISYPWVLSCLLIYIMHMFQNINFLGQRSMKVSLRSVIWPFTWGQKVKKVITHAYVPKHPVFRSSEANEGQSEVSPLTSHVSGHIFIVILVSLAFNWYS